MNQGDENRRRKVPSSRGASLRQFDVALMRLSQILLDRRLSHLMSKNKLTLHHGHGWDFTREDMSSDTGAMTRGTATISVSHESQVANDMSAFRAAIDSMVEQLAAQMSRRVYEVVGEAAEKVGNVVSIAEAGSLSDAFVRMIETVEFGVDEEGKITMPALHDLPPEMIDRWLREIEARGPEFEQQVEAIKARKSREALDREAARLSRYKSDGAL